MALFGIFEIASSHRDANPSRVFETPVGNIHLSLLLSEHGCHRPLTLALTASSEEHGAFIDSQGQELIIMDLIIQH
ncbi:Disintegrin And Metalloproteinase Domain-Containing Protein 20 [Manis pentadactyla]|nr:Disintegrin And Metalloproteinase Domain-Containing Protein 20 [Manis pentadactyla]